MPASQSTVLDFLKRHRVGVQASHAEDGAPQAALVGFVVNERLELFFDTFESTRKCANLGRDPRVAFVIGGSPGDERTVQYEGVVDVPSGKELREFQDQYFAALPDGLRRSVLPGVRYYRVRPRWIRYSDYNSSPPEIIELDAGTAAGASVCGRLVTPS